MIPTPNNDVAKTHSPDVVPISSDRPALMSKTERRDVHMWFACLGASSVRPSQYVRLIIVSITQVGAHVLTLPLVVGLYWMQMQWPC